jgi:predicted dehydrogenase
MFPDGLGKAAPSEPPKDLDWDLWLGPRPERAFQATIAPYKFRWWDLYSSQMGNWGVHFLVVMRWLLGEEAPVSVCAMGGRYVIDDDRTVPDTAEAMFEFKKGRLLTFAQYEACGNPCMATDERFRPLGEIELRGTNGTLFINSGGWKVFPEYGGQYQKREARMEKQSKTAETWSDGTEFHVRNFLDCMRSRQTPNCDVEEGHRSTTMSLIANISLAVRQRLDWDPVAEKFIGNDAANQLLHYEYRAPWKLEV